MPADTSLSTLDLGKLIVDSFIDECSSGYYGNELTLSVTDLTYIPQLFESMYDFFAESETSLVKDNLFIAASHALGESRAVSDNEDLVDLIYLIQSMDGSEALLEELSQCVVYNGTTIKDHNGLCRIFRIET